MHAVKASSNKGPLFFRKEFHPWGTCLVMGEGVGYKVRRITVYPGQAFGLRKHYHRLEHWLVVRGTALVTCGDAQALLPVGKSIDIPIGLAHRVENPGKLNLEIIEVQHGEYVGENDLIRL